MRKSDLGRPTGAPVLALRSLSVLGVLASLLLGCGGCATPGPLHVYSLATPTATSIADTGPAPAADVSSFLAPGEVVTGFAYDPFTDHFFLRLAPGDRIRVVDRPARAVKREFAAERTPATGGGDLAVRPRDGHLFLIHPTEPTLIELNRFGNFIRLLPLGGLTGPAGGVAFDTARDRLLVLTGLSVAVYDLDGKMLATIPLDRPVVTGALGFDSDQRELYAPLADHSAVGVFGEDGRWRRSLVLDAKFFDVGPRSYLRMF